MSWLAALLLLAAIPGTADAQSTVAPAGDPAAASVITPAGQPADQIDDTGADLTPSIEELLASGEIIEIWDERPAKPFERDTKLRLTGEELARRGVTNLADALELIPEINVRDVGRGGRQIDIRGGRKGSVKILIDGIPVGDPYYGNFDVSSIPVTDIVEVRVSAAPASPIDGSGGPGGVVEVHTRDAVGPRLLSARADASSLPDGLLSASSRTMLSTSWAIRISATGTLGARNLGVVMPGGARGVLDEDRRSASSASRLEYRSGSRRIALDLTADHGSYLVPPSEDVGSRVLSVDGATSGRAGLVVEDQLAAWRLQARGYAQASIRDSTYYTDATMSEITSSEHLVARRFGGGLLFNRAIGDHLHVLGSAVLDAESGERVDMTGTSAGGSASISEVAGGARFVRGRVDMSGSAGLAVPIGIDAAPWPEAKISAQYRFARRAAVKVIGGHKGRLPTLRERFESNFGNESLGPEKAWYAEVALTVDRNRFFEADIAGYIRPTSGMIRSNGNPEMLMLINTGALTIRGIDARVTLLPEAAVSAGALAGVLRAHSAEQGDDPIDRLPDSYGELWMAVRLGSYGGGRVRARYTGEQVDKDETLPGHSTVDISTYWHLSRALVGTVRVDNLLDNRYLDRAGGIVAVGRVVTLSLQSTWK